MTTAAPSAAPPLHRDLRVLAYVLAAAISRAGDLAWFVGLGWTATSLAGPAVAGLVIGLGALPRAAVLLLGGALADRLDARRTMVIANLARTTVLVAGIAAVELGSGSPSIALLVVVSLVFGAIDACYDPAASTLVRQLVRADDLGPFAGVLQIGYRVAALVGAPLGGLAVATAGITAVMVVNAAGFVVVALVLATLLRPRFALDRVVGCSIWGDLRDGLRYIAHDVQVRTLVLALSGLNLFVGPVLAVGLVLATQDAGWTSTDLGIFNGCVAAGGIAGAAVALRWRPRRPARNGLLLLVLQALGCAAIGWGSYAALVVGVTTIGVTAGLASALLSGVFQRTVRTAYLGRTSSVLTLVDNALMPAAMAGFGALVAATSIALASAITAVLFAALAVWSATRPGLDAVSRETLRAQPERDPVEAAASIAAAIHP